MRTPIGRRRLLRLAKGRGLSSRAACRLLGFSRRVAGYLSLLTDLRQGGVADELLRERRDELQATLARIYQTAPRTTSRAYASAQAGLQQNEELTFSEAEIDQLLPSALRSSTTPE